MKQSSPRLFWSAAAIFLTISPCAAQKFRQKNLVSDVPGLAKFTDPDLKNPWGISEGSTTPFWVSDEVTGKSTLYNSGGTKLGLVVDVVGGHPTGTFFQREQRQLPGRSLPVRNAERHDQWMAARERHHGDQARG
jgi:hypothetical protein